MRRERSGLSDLMGSSFDDFPAWSSPLDRIILTANGNLQRIVSSLSNAPVEVRVLHNERTGPGKYDRKVSISCAEEEFCIATSVVSITSPHLVKAVESKKVGLGQLFRKYDLLPQFTLLKVGKTGVNFYRVYALKAHGIECEICESFSRDLSTLGENSPLFSPHAENNSAPDSSKVESEEISKAHFGDLMSGTQAKFLTFSKAFSPLERVLISANGNVGRILSSYFNKAVAIVVEKNHCINSTAHGTDIDNQEQEQEREQKQGKEDDQERTYARCVSMACNSHRLMKAESLITVRRPGSHSKYANRCRLRIDT